MGPGALATTQGSAPPCRSSVRRCARPSMFGAIIAFSMSSLPGGELRCGALDLRRNVRAEQGKGSERTHPRLPTRRHDRPHKLDAGRVHRQAVQDDRQIRAAGPSVKSPARWGTKSHLDALFGARATVAAESKYFAFRYKSPEHWIELICNYYGPV